MAIEQPQHPELDRDKIGEFQTKLETMRDELLHEFATKRGAKRQVEAYREVGDDQDWASDERVRELELLLSEQDQQQLREIEAALERIREGTYGICEETDEPIPLRRLKSIPTARYTVEAQAALEDESVLDRARELDEENETYARMSEVAEEEGLGRYDEEDEESPDSVDYS